MSFTAASGVWHAPLKVAVSLNSGGFAQTTAVSCGSPGNCGAVGSYESDETSGSAFVENEVDGSWRAAQTVPVQSDYSYRFTAISCPSAGNCAAVGEIEGISAFVMDETGGTWGKPRGLATGELEAVSCMKAGDCVAGGTLGYGKRAFLVTQTDDTWGKPQAVPGSTDVDASIMSISCPSIGNCAAAGNYDAQPYGPLPGIGYPFVVDETAGTWGSAMRLKGPFDYKDELDAVDTVTSISCSSPGNCGAGGYYGAFQGFQQAFVVSETKGTWGSAHEAAGSLDAGKRGWLQSVSCPTDGNCTAVGSYNDAEADLQAYVIDEADGKWHPAKEVAGSLNVDGYAWLNSVSCASTGNCSAAGYYADADGAFVGLVVTETDGSWGSGQAVVQSPIADGLAQVNSVSCPSVGNCAAGGAIDDINDHQQAFVVVAGKSLINITLWIF